jgi:hypothetical protein
VLEAPGSLYISALAFLAALRNLMGSTASRACIQPYTLLLRHRQRAQIGRQTSLALSLRDSVTCNTVKGHLMT